MITLTISEPIRLYLLQVVNEDVGSLTRGRWLQILSKKERAKVLREREHAVRLIEALETGK